MDATSTINKTWSICTFASFIGCTILVLFLNQGQDGINFLAIRNIAWSFTSLNPNSNAELSKPVINRWPVKEKEEKCNVFDGSWVYDPENSPLYTAAQCPFLGEQVSCQRNGRPDSEYERWSWEAKECRIPRFNGTDTLERLRGKRVIIVGDSLNRNQWESLACLLYSSIPSSRAHVDFKKGDYKIFQAKDYNCSVEFFWSPFLVQHNQEPENGSRILKLDELSTSAQEWRGADFMVFNTGHWWIHSGKMRAWDLFQHDGKLVEEMEIESAFGIAMKTWAQWIEWNVDASKTAVFFRSISPQHAGKMWCYNATQPIMDESFTYAFPKQIQQILQRTIAGMKTPVKYLNITKLSEHRRDAHPSTYARKQKKLLVNKTQQQRPPRSDCSHWCLPGVPDTWNRLLYASILSESYI